MKISKAISTVGVGAAIVAGSMLAVNAASAHSIFGGSDENQAEAVSEFAERFNLDESEVQAYFDEKKAERQAEMGAKRAEHIASLVEDGTLSQEQADALTAKQEEMKATRDALRDQDLTREEIHEKMEEARTEFEAWAEEQGIDLDSIRPERGKGHHDHQHSDNQESESSTDSTDEEV
jgi:hypothetical protein